jgi:gliding motility-associated-like protein
MNEGLLKMACGRWSRYMVPLISTIALSTAQAQLVVNSQTDLQTLALDIAGPGVTISNPQINCPSQGYGEFQYSGSLLGIDEGVLLTSGKIVNAIGPNNSASTTSQQYTSGNGILNIVTGRTTYDACKFEFDVIPAGDSLRFDFVFGSEEYNEWVGSQYNDVFGFFISGPGITGDPGIGNDRNIALVPGSSQAVTINNVNNGSNQAYYHDNAGGQFIQYDGITQGLSAYSPVQPCETYHLKLIVADASDREYDSGVFIAKVKSNPVTMTPITVNGGPDLIEGCNAGVVRFTRQLVTDQPLSLEYYIQGTATNGTDYNAVGDPDPAAAKTIVIPANEAFVEQPLTPIADGIPENAETLRFILGNPNCPGSVLDSITINLTDSLTAGVQPSSSTVCEDGQVQLTAVGGTQYTWSPIEGLSAGNIADPIAHPATTTTYSVTIQNGTCTRTVQSLVKVGHLSLSANITPPLCSGAGNGAINLALTGGLAPFTYQWSGPEGFSATTEDIANIPSGTYTVTVTDASCTRTQSFNVGQPAPLSVSLAPSLLVFGQNISCNGGHDGTIDATVTGGTGPYVVNWTGPNGFSSSSIDLSGLSAGTYVIHITDAGGCSATASTTMVDTAPMNASITSQNDVACANDASGSATVSISGGVPNYSYAWSTVPVQTSSTATGLSPGTYTVTATDLYGCSTTSSAIIGGPVQPVQAILTGSTDVACFGTATGSASVNASGGTAPYTYSWNTMPVQENAEATGLAGGNYTVTVTDDHGCSTSLMAAIASPSLPLSITSTAQQNVACFGMGTGSATVTASGGSAPYAYSWNTVPPHAGATATGLAAGSYTVSATDAHACSATLDVVITGPVSGLAATILSSTDVHCANGTDGTATVVANGGTGPYTYAWATTPVQNVSTATGLGTGSWAVLVNDANNCQASASATIASPAAIAVTGIISPALCQGAANGAVDLTTTGGMPPYSWSWTGPSGFASSLEDISSLNAGGYSVTVTDANGCSTTQAFDVNQPGLFTVNTTAAVHGLADVSCVGGTDGAIDLTVGGAVPPYAFSWTGPDGFTASTEDIGGLSAGGYSVTITDVNGCSTSESIGITAPEMLDIQLFPSDHHGSSISCNGGSDGTITTQAAGGNPPYSFSWTGPAGFTSDQSDLGGLSAGLYVLTVTDANGCSSTRSIALSGPAPLIATNGGTVAQTCYGSGTGQATVSVTGGAMPYSYAWNTVPVQHGASATGLMAGVHTVTVSDVNGCATSADIVIDGPSGPLALELASVTNVLCNAGQNGAATVQATGGTGPYAYAWNTVPPINDATATSLSAGIWTATGTDAHGCTTSLNVPITQPAQPLSADLLDRHDVTCFGADDGTASIEVSGGSGEYSVTWNTMPVQTGGTLTGSAPGTYTATIADANGCAQMLSFPVVIDGPTAAIDISLVPSTYAGGGNISCTEAEDGGINVSVSGGTPPYNYFWEDGQGGTMNTEDLTGLAAGTYHFSVQDGHGCFSDTSVTLMPPSALSASAAVESAICHGESNGAIDLTVAGGASPYTYQWNGPDGFTSEDEDHQMIPAGVYFVTVTDANGCTLVQPFDVTEPGTFIFSATISTYAGGYNTSCSSTHDGSIELTASGGTAPYGYAWSGPQGYSADTADIASLVAGNYHLVLTDDNGCSALSSYVLNAPPALHAFSISSKNHGGYDLSCAGANDGEITTTISGGTPPYIYSWTGPDGFTSADLDINGLAVGQYVLTVTDANGCSVSTTTYLVAPPPLTATTVVGNFPDGSPISCAGANDGSITITPDGGTTPISVAWSGPAGFASFSWQITGLAPGNYSALVTDINGCSLSIDTLLTAPAPILLSTATTSVSCNGGQTGAIDLSVSGGASDYHYQWAGPGTFASTSQDLLNTAAGAYQVTITDANGCTAMTSAVITEPTAITASAEVVTASCQGANTGSIDLSVSGGSPGYSYLWSGFPAFSANSQDISALLAGSYSVAITDANGCTFQASYNVGEPGLFDISAELSSYAGGYNVSCADASNGSIDVTVSGGSPGYTYLWTGPDGFTAIGQDISGLSPGEYVLTVHDANGCNASAAFTLVAPSPITIGLASSIFPGGNNTGCEDSTDGSIDASVSGGVGPYGVLWTGPDGPLGINEDQTGLGAGTYAISVTDALGCTASSSIALVGPVGLSVIAEAFTYPNGSNLSCAGSSDGSIDLTVTGGTSPLTVAWTGPNGSTYSDQDLSGLGAGTYTATVTDANGCSSAAQVTLVAPPAIILDINTSQYSGGVQVSCSGATDGSIASTVTGGSPGYSVNWAGPNGFTSDQYAIDGLVPGSYTLLVTDLSNCSASTIVTLTAPPPIMATAALSDFNGFQVGCSGNDGSIDLTVDGGQPGYQFDWAGPSGFASQAEDLASLSEGTYGVTITDANGCSLFHSYHLAAPQSIAVSLDVTSNECDLSNDASIDLTLSGGVAPFTFAWTGPNGFTSNDADLTDLPSGGYAVTVTDAMDCSTTVTAQVTAPSPIDLGLYVSTYGSVNIPCKGDSTGVVDLMVEGGFAPLSVTWTGPNGFTADTTNLTGLVAGTYAVHVVDDHGCGRDTTVTLVEPATPINVVLTASFYPSGTNIACYGNADGSIEATAIGGDGPYSFDWRGPDSASYSTEDISGLGTGDYELVLTDMNQCSSTVWITLTGPDTALYSILDVPDHNGYGTSCASSADGAIAMALLGGSPAYDLSWNGPGGFTSTSDSIGGLSPGTYVLTATDMNGCELTRTVAIEAPPAIVPSLFAATYPSGTNISCAGMNDGSVTAAVSGGVPSLTLLWSGPDGFSSTANDLDGLAAGTYCLEASDANGCTAQACVALTAPDTLDVATMPTAAACGRTNGAVQTAISGGSAPYSPVWDSGQNTSDLADVPAGTYALVVTDANGCTATGMAIVEGTPAVQAEAIPTEPLCHDGEDGAIDLTVNSGIAPFTYLWNGTWTSEDLDSLAGGTYAITVTDVNGCAWDTTYVLSPPPAIGADTSVSVYANGNNISIYQGHDGSIAVEPVGGTPPYALLWSTGATGNALTGLSAGTYTVTITDDHGCSLPLIFILDGPDVLEMPSGFTPNDDGQNDLFVVHGIDGYPNNQLTVFNRWGNVVFDQLNYSNNWNGENQQGRPLPDGTYFVVLKLGDAITLQHYVDLRR